MSSMSELKNLNVDDLKRRARDVKETLFRDRIKLKTGSLESPAARTEKKRELARILTAITQKERSAKSPAA